MSHKDETAHIAQQFCGQMQPHGAHVWHPPVPFGSTSISMSRQCAGLAPAERAASFEETRWIGIEQCPNGPAVHVAPMTITSSSPLVRLETPGNITTVKACGFCHPPTPTDRGA